MRFIVIPPLDLTVCDPACGSGHFLLKIYGAMAEATRTGSTYQTLLDPPPGQGLRHHAC